MYETGAKPTFVLLSVSLSLIHNQRTKKLKIKKAAPKNHLSIHAIKHAMAMADVIPEFVIEMRFCSDRHFTINIISDACHVHIVYLLSTQSPMCFCLSEAETSDIVLIHCNSSITFFHQVIDL